MHSNAVTFALLLSFVTHATAVIVDAATFADTTYDFIIVGGGTAGVALATRLSEVSSFTVGVIEAGGYKPDDPRILVPLGYDTGGTWGNPDYDWAFYTKPQPRLANRAINMVRGKILGGSSALNLMGVLRAGAVEYDQIGALGNAGWSWDQMLSYFKKTENITAADPADQEQHHATYTPAYHGTSGHLKTSFSKWYSDAITPYWNTLVAMGIPQVQDGEGPSPEVRLINPTLSIDPDKETRSYSAVAYYEPNAARPNLQVLLNSQVIKVVLSSKPDSKGNYAATGVTYVTAGRTYTSTVKKEVVLCAGGVQTPQVLELSGIGNSTILGNFGIASKIEIPTVGENYQDHLIVAQDYEVPSDIETWDILSNPGLNATAYADYLKNGTGPYASSITAGGYIAVSNFIEPATLENWTAQLDAQFYASNPTPGQLAMYQIQRARLNYTSTEASLELYATPSNTGPNHVVNGRYISMAAFPIHPFSRGSIHINSSDPLAYPEIDLNAFAYDIDKQMMTQGMVYVSTIASTEPLKGLIIAPSYPSTGTNTTYTEWEDFVVNNAATPFHPCCTAAMLPQKLGGVVSNKLIVYGTSNLRVADISILPLQLATHLQATAYAIAEQAADFIKAEWA